MRVAHLFAGAGGGLLADLIIGHTPVLAVEINEFCCQVLRERKEDGWFPELQIECSDVREFDFKPYSGRVDCIAAGFPCQDISTAGKGGGIDGERSGLVWEVFRAIDETEPDFVFLENSPNIRTKGRGRITAALVARGYRWRDGKIAASNVGAGHKRERWFLLASNSDSINGDMGGFSSSSISQLEKAEISGYENAADIMRDRLQIAMQRNGLSKPDAETIEAVARYTGSYDWSPPDAGICRVVDGISNRTHRIKALGNAQVPAQAALAFIILSGFYETCLELEES